MISLYDVTGGEIYKNINRTILDVNVTNIYWIIMGGKYDAIYTDDYSRHGYYIIKFSSYLYTLQEGLRVDGQVISSVEMVCKELISFQSILILIIKFYKELNPLTNIFL